MARRFGSEHRPYARSHPWISFTYQMDRQDCRDFLHIGEALSKSDHIACVPLPPHLGESLNEIYLARGLHATTQIEGNSLTEDQVRARVQGELPLPESQEYLGKEIDNVLSAYNLVLKELAEGRDIQLTRHRIELFNKMVLDGLPNNDGVVPGKIRTRGVEVGNVYAGPPAGDCKYLLDQLCAWLNQLQVDAGSEWYRPMGLIRAILAHLYLAWIHPFGDGNGRTARLVEFQLLLQAGFPSPACHLLADYYNKTRQLYYQVLNETSRDPSHPVWRFISYALKGFVEELREQLAYVNGNTLTTAWINFVHEADLGITDNVAKRRRNLVLALPNEGPEHFTPISSISRLTPDLAAAYAGTTHKTLTRDIHALQDADLLVRRGQSIRPHVERLLAFLPLCDWAANGMLNA
jgi:Fic family protein